MDSDSHLADLDSAEEELVIWEKRLILMSAFGLVGLGTVVGGCSIYIRYIKLQVEKHIAINTISALQQSSEIDGVGKKDGDSLTKSYASKGTETGDLETFGGTAGGEGSIKSQVHGSLPSTAGDSAAAAVLVTDEVDNLEFFFFSIDELLDGTAEEQHEAYGKLKSTGDKLNSVGDYWWRMAKATHIEAQMAEQQQDKDSQKSLLMNAVGCAEKALKINDNSADAHKWFAITSGSRGEFLKINERIQSGYIFKEHVDRALELNPSDSSLHHLLGRFCFEVSQLSWVERRAAAMLFSSPPTATIQEALHHFQESEKLGLKPLIENQLYLAKCYISLNEPLKVAFWLQSASRLPAKSAADKKAQVTVSELLNKYKKYLL